MIIITTIHLVLWWSCLDACKSYQILVIVFSVAHQLFAVVNEIQFSHTSNQFFSCDLDTDNNHQLSSIIDHNDGTRSWWLYRANTGNRMLVSCSRCCYCCYFGNRSTSKDEVSDRKYKILLPDSMTRLPWRADKGSLSLYWLARWLTGCLSGSWNNNKYGIWWWRLGSSLGSQMNFLLSGATYNGRDCSMTCCWFSNCGQSLCANRSTPSLDGCRHSVPSL